MAKKKRAPDEINASSMADIAFLLLVFFLVTTTMDTEWGLARRLPPPLPPEWEKPPPVKDRNIMVVLVNANNQLLVRVGSTSKEGDLMDISHLKNATKEFIANPYNKSNLPQKERKEVAFIGAYDISKQIVSLQNDRGTSYDMYIQVQNELAAAYNELRNELAMEKFGTSFDNLVEDKDKARVKAIQMIYPQRISEAEPKAVGS